MNDPIEITTDRNELPEGEAQLVIREEGLTIVIQGDAEKVERRLNEQMADEFNMTVEELERVEEYPMPDFDEGVVPAEEFYDSGE